MKKIFGLMAILLGVILLSTSVFALNDIRQNSNNKTICATAYQIRPGNQINYQVPHFACCKCLADCPTCPCAGDWCINGDTLKKQIRLVPTDFCGADCGLDGQVVVNVRNYKGLDMTDISVRINKLFPRNSVFTVWLVDNEGSNIQIGTLRTNAIGRGFVHFKQNLADFTIFDGVQIMDSDMNLVSSTNLGFICSHN